MMMKKIEELYPLLKKQSGKKKMAVAVAQDENVIEAIYNAYKQEIVQPLLFGDKTLILDIFKKLNLDFQGIEIIDEKDKIKAAELAVKSVRANESQILMKGNIGTADILRAVLNKDWGLRKGDVLSHFALFELERYHKVLAVSDVAMNVEPDLMGKVGILKNCLACLQKLEIKNPKVAMLAAVELVNADMKSTMDAAMISKMAQRGQLGSCIVDGPLAWDNAISAESAHHKKIVSEVAGDADLIIVPNLETGNAVYKAMMYFAGAKLAAVILGGLAPVVLTSRSDSDESKLNSILLAAVC